MSDKPRTKTNGVALSPTERQIVEAVSTERGLYNFSASVRQIIREWAEMRKTWKPPTPQGNGEIGG